MSEDRYLFRKSPIPGLRIAARLTATAMVVSLASGDLRAPAAELTAPSIQATIDRGTITALHRSPSGPNMLRAPVKVEITPGTAAPIAEDATTFVSMSAAGRRAAAERSSEPEGLSWRHEWEVNHGSLAIRTTFTNLASERRSVGISWRFAFDGADCEPFFSGEHLAPEWPASEVSWYSYLTDRDDAHRLNIPL